MKSTDRNKIHASGFKDFILKPECLRAVVDCGVKHPFEVQHECTTQAILGMDIVCQVSSVNNNNSKITN